MIVINSQTHSVQIGEMELPKNSVYFKTEVGQNTVSIFTTSGFCLVLSNLVTDFADGSNGNAPFDTMANLVTALRAAMFA